MAARYRSAYRRYLFWRRMRLILTLTGGVIGIVTCYFMYMNLVRNGLTLGPKEMLPMLLVLAASFTLPWLVGSAFVKKPSEL
ncbi:MAG TPA: hypothetical protein VHL31_03700 [Geminicoccus sp.]|jgi:hypothetical protein|uniref:hypothetical protein n=1 Tax=Geminicoccus sp. TaxID=2024832 RepID=UPI002E35BB1D|nr:hypothetical protein [Geminicoccus sp.]HEX2525393.1 hypothetical protein [Geminicoccus sp.]